MKAIGIVLVIAAIVLPAWMIFDYYGRVETVEYLKLEYAERSQTITDSILHSRPISDKYKRETHAMPQEIDRARVERDLAGLRLKYSSFGFLIIWMVGVVMWRRAS